MSHVIRLLLGLTTLGLGTSIVSAADTAGTWNTTASGNWSDSTKWLGGTIADGAGFTATFSAPAPNTSSPTVTIALDSDRTIGNLSFTGTAGTGTHNFTLNGPGTLTLSGGTPTISSSLEARTATINVTLAGSSGLSLANTGVGLIIGGSNTYTGLTQITTGIITVNNNLAFGSTTGATSILNGNGAILLNNGIVVTGETLNTSGNGTGANLGAIHTASNATAEWAGNIALTGSSRFGANGASSELILSGVISDSDTIARNVSFSYGGNSDINGTVTLKGASTYTGDTNVYRGTLKLDAGNNRLPTGTSLIIGGTSVDATVNLNGYNQSVAVLKSLAGTGVRTLTNTSGTTSTFTVNQTTGTQTFDGIVSGKIAFVKSGAGTLNLTGTANTFTGGITVDGGTLGIVTAFIADTADVSIASGAVFALNFSGTDTISGLYLASIAQTTGTYGSLTSTATNKSAFFTGTGLLEVTSYSAPIPEPASAAILGGLAVLSLTLLRRRRSA